MKFVFCEESPETILSSRPQLVHWLSQFTPHHQSLVSSFMYWLLLVSEYSSSLVGIPNAFLKYLSYSQRACSMFFNNTSLSRKPQKDIPRASEPDFGSEVEQTSLMSLVCFNSPFVVGKFSAVKSLLTPFLAPAPRLKQTL